MCDVVHGVYMAAFIEICMCEPGYTRTAEAKILLKIEVCVFEKSINISYNI